MKVYKVISLISVSFCFLFITTLTYFINRYNIPIYDDQLSSFVNTFYHGKHLVYWIFPFFCNKLSSLFNIHYIIWYQTVLPIIKGIIIFFLMYNISSLAFISLDNKKNQSLMFPILIIANYTIFQLLIFEPDGIRLYTSSIYYILPFLFFVLFIKKLIIVIFYENNRHNINILCLLCIINGMTNDFIAIVSIFLLIFILIFKKYFYSISKKQLALLLLFTSTSFATTLFHKGMISSLESYNYFRPINQLIIETINNFILFNIKFFQVFINKYAIIILFIIMLSLLIYNKKIKDRMFFISFVIISGFIFLYSLIFCSPLADREHTSIGILSHYEIILCIQMLLLVVLNYTFGIVYNQSKKIAIIFFLGIIISTLCIYNQFIKNNIEENFNIKTQKEQIQTRYVLERIFAYYGYKGMNPIIYGKVSESNSYINDSIFSFKCDNSELVQIILKYQYKVQSDNILSPICKNTIKEVIWNYKKDGGPDIHRDEINLANFNKLLDKNYVINGKKE